VADAPLQPHQSSIELCACGVAGHLFDCPTRIAAVEAERDRCKAALEAIRDDPNPEAGWRIARETLEADRG
jgi:hypothetical protein